MSITSVPGVTVGHWTDGDAMTGCTVIVPPTPNTAAVEIRGGAPGTREVGLLAPGMAVTEIHALLLTGGSAFGLAAADGVVTELEQDGVGHPTMFGVVPIVPGAVIYDLGVGDSSVRPDRASGAAAYRARSSEAVVAGRIGAGTGATVSKWRGIDSAMPAGLASVSLACGDATVGVLVVLNAVGDVVGLDGEVITGPGPDIPIAVPPTPFANTTLVAVMTDAKFSRDELGRLAIRSQDALAATLRPAHTRYDGDASFVVSCGDVRADLDQMMEVVFLATAQAIVEAASV